MIRKAGSLILALFVSVSAHAQKETSHPPSLALTPEQSAFVEKAIDREKAIAKLIQKSTPVVQTYIQNVLPDSQLSSIPVSDQYSLARVDFGKSQGDSAYETHPTSTGLFKGTTKFLNDLTKSLHMSQSVTGFMEMMLLDPARFDQQHYDFSYVRREFLGSVRTLVFDVSPKPHEVGESFAGRIWVEDQDGNIVRFSGFYTGSRSGNARSFHFDSWRANVQPDAWLPSTIYVEETQPGGGSKATGLRAQIYFWGYSLKLPTTESDDESLTIDGVQDEEEQPQELSPLEAQRQWASQAEQNVLDRMTRAGLLAPPGDFDKVLEAITNAIVIGNKLEFAEPIRCRILLTYPLESLSIGNTILVSKGLIDVVPSEESLAAVLSFQLAHILLGHRINTRFAFNDRLLFPDEATFSRIGMHHSDQDNEAAAKKAIELFDHSVYRDKAASAGLFFRQLQAREKQLSSLLTPRLGDSLIRADGKPWMAALARQAPGLHMDNPAQISALPLNSHLRIDPWSGKLYQVNEQPVLMLAAAEKRPLEIMPVYPRLERYPTLPNDNAAHANQNETDAARLPYPSDGALPPSPPQEPAHTIPVFDWPPPRTSATLTIPNEVLIHNMRDLDLGDVNKILVDALSANGYSELSYFRTPDLGFVLVTRLEHIEDDGSPMMKGSPASRWGSKQSLSITNFSLTDYLHALLMAPSGYYRIIAFAVTNSLFSQGKQAVNEQVAADWLKNGWNGLPSSITREKYGMDMKCTALIYEFKVPTDKKPSDPVPVQNHLDAKTHLVKSGVWASLAGK